MFTIQTVLLVTPGLQQYFTWCIIDSMYYNLCFDDKFFFGYRKNAVGSVNIQDALNFVVTYVTGYLVINLVVRF
jgi:hypothetical protein